MKIKRTFVVLVVVLLLSATISNIFAALTEPGNLVISPNYELGRTANATYYFNSFSVGEHWETDYAYISDGDETTYGTTSQNGHTVHLLNGNTCLYGTNLGTILKVEVRAKGSYAWSVDETVRIDLRPIFTDGDGDNHTFTLPRNIFEWSEWFNITDDTNAPSTWSWYNVSNLNCDLESLDAISTGPYCSKVEIRVNYVMVKQGFSVSWDMGTDADLTILVFKNNSTPNSIDDGYKYFLKDSYTNMNFSGIFHEGLPFNKNYSCLGFSGAYPFGKSTRNLEDGIPLTFMDNSTDLASSYFSIDGTSKVNGTYSMKFTNPSATSGEIFGCRHFESNHTWDNFSIHCLIDTKDSGTSDDALAIQPYDIINETGNATYYFNSFSVGEHWETDYAHISDGNENTYGYTDYPYIVHLLNGNNCPTTNLGNITKVELRAKGYYTFDVVALNPRMYIRPVFADGDGNNHTFTLPRNTGVWSEWFDITDDTNAPSTWGWDDIDLLDCDLMAALAPSPPVINVIPYCSKVEILVTYTDYVEMLPRVNFTDTDYIVSGYNVTVGNHGLLDTWVADRVYNITYSIYGEFINVTIDDYNGNTGYVNESYNISGIDGFLVSMDRDVVRNAYLDNWVEVNASTVTSTYASTYNWTYPSKPFNFNESGEYSTAVNLTWDASDSFYHWDKIQIQKSLSGYPNSPSDGDTLYFGNLTYAEDVLNVSEMMYYSAWGYGDESGFYSNEYGTASHQSSPLRAYFSYHPKTVIRVGDIISFTDSSVGNIVTWKWDFGDSTIAYGKNQDHSYDHIGDFIVTLQVTDANSNNDKHSKTIHVSLSEYPYISPPVTPEYPSGYDILDLYPVFNTDELKIVENKITVVVIDSGYTPRVYRSIDMTNIQGYKLDEFSTIYDDNGHGTFVTYEIASLLQTKCPNAEIISFKVFDESGASTPEGFLFALDFVKNMHPDVISISAGAFGNIDDPYSLKMDELRKEGIVVLVAAAGNLGPDPGTILSPALSDSCIAIGSFNNKGTVETSDDVISEWSSRGPVQGVSHKPDVAGIGESIVGPWMYGEKVVSGTSMAAPMIAAGSAVVIAEHKGIIDIVKTLYFWDKSYIGQSFEDALKESCSKPSNYEYDGGVHAWGAGIPDFALTSELFYEKLIVLLIIPILIIICIAVFLVYFFVIRKR